MRKTLKLIMAGLLCVCVISSVSITTEAAMQVEETVESNSSEGIISAEITIPKEEVMGNLTRALYNGEVEGNGVRLRVNASTSAAVLELMYNGEAVKVNTLETVKKNGIKWYYVKRIKTGTWGYADSEFIIY